MTTRADIEAEIARLQSRLQRTEMDLEFTPIELVRWDPSLIGTLLRIQHYKDIPANAFEIFYSDKYNIHKPVNLCESIKDTEWFGRSRSDFESSTWGYNWADSCMNTHCVLTKFGCKTHTGFNDENPSRMPPNSSVWTPDKIMAFRMKWEDKNQFENFTVFKRIINSCSPHFVAKLSNYDGSTTHYVKASLPCSAFSLKILKIRSPTQGFDFEELHIPLADPDKSLLDQIFIATSTKIPGLDKEVVINNYSLSTLYKEWKADKDAGRSLRKTPLVEAHETIAALRKELQALNEDREALLDKRGRLVNALHIATNINCTTDPL